MIGWKAAFHLDVSVSVSTSLFGFAYACGVVGNNNIIAIEAVNLWKHIFGLIFIQSAKSSLDLSSMLRLTYHKRGIVNSLICYFMHHSFVLHKQRGQTTSSCIHMYSTVWPFLLFRDKKETILPSDTWIHTTHIKSALKWRSRLIWHTYRVATAITTPSLLLYVYIHFISVATAGAGLTLDMRTIKIWK